MIEQLSRYNLMGVPIIQNEVEKIIQYEFNEEEIRFNMMCSPFLT